VQEDWVLCRVVHKNKTDTDSAMESEQEVIRDAAVKGYNYASSSMCHHNPDYHSPPVPFPSLVSHHYELPSSSHDLQCLSIDAFSSMPPLLNYDSILDFSQHLSDSLWVAGSRIDGGDKCDEVLRDLGLKEEHYNYDNLL
jgi:hypothetical protein